VVIAGNSDPIFRRLMQAVGRPDLADDPALQSNDGRVLRNEELDGAILAWTREHPTAAILDALEKAGVPACRIYSAADIVTDPHYQARGMIQSAELPDGERVRMPGVVPKLESTPGEVRWLGPAIGEHTEEVLGELGFSADDIAGLRLEGAVL
jgi:crotonobetainyl-CoA:carnitine CoA-transferase CaiB-like acyl-CoA transferase